MAQGFINHCLKQLTRRIHAGTIISMVSDVFLWRLSRSCLAAAALSTVLSYQQVSHARDLLPPKEQESTEIGTTQSPSFDAQENDIPQSLFTWIKMAKGFDVEWDTFGRKGWYAQDPRLKPIESSSVFAPEVPVIYIVFEVAPLEDPAQFAVQWYLEPVEQLNERPLGKDVLEVSGHERYGYLELKRSGAGWTPGAYIAKIYIAPIGQQPFHAGNQVGVMRFSIADHAPASWPEHKAIR